MDDPYTPTRHAYDAARTEAVASARQGIQWRRVGLASVAILVAILLSAAASALLAVEFVERFMPDRWQDMLVALDVLQVAIFLAVATPGYWWLAAGVAYRRLLHVLIAWSLLQAITIALFLLMQQDRLDPFSWRRMLLELLPALVGWTLTWLWPGRRQYVAREET